MEGMYHEAELRSLFSKYLQKDCSDEEIKLLVAYSQADHLRPVWEALLDAVKEDTASADLYQLYKPAIDRTYAQILATGINGPSKTKTGFIRYWRPAAAAALLLLCTTSTYLWLRHPAAKQLTHVTPDLRPGTNKALLTLANGDVITLDSAGHQVLQQGSAAVRQQGGQLTYDVQGIAATASYNTINTPRGGQFRIVLSDGTGVWLNASSSLRFPTTFVGQERTVEVTGEAYFDVAKNPAMPFRVKVAGRAEIEVLGTSFNVDAYLDEPSIKTTLVNGSIKIHAQDHSLILLPGQQAELTADGQLQLVKESNMAASTAKDGFFSFTRADLPTVMRQLARWYDVDVTYTDSIPTVIFTGDIDKSLTLDQVLKALAKNRIHYRIEDNRKLIILP